MKKFLLLLFFINLFSFSLFSQAPNYSDSTITRPASYQYSSSAFGRLFLGSHYRKVWSAPVTMPYLDLEHMLGGLTPVKRGGGFQTISLRLMSKDSNQYVIRTVDKDPRKTVSSAFQNTIVTDLIQDQISASHPYGALVVPPLSKDLGIYHSNPIVMYVPDDPNLGQFRDAVKNRVVLFEEKKLRSADVESGLGGFAKVKDTWDVYDAIHKSSDNWVDEKWLLRSRLFDMLIGDWDRHEDQWQWAQFNMQDGTKMFRPIPVDRDQAFFNFDGVIPTIASLNVTATRKMQRYRQMPVSTKWFNFNGRYIDHNFLSRMTHDDWRSAADSILLLLTDDKIEQAFKVWPDTVYKLSAPEIIKTLKLRRDNLPLIADKYYDFLSKNVTVVGTNKSDYFEVKRLMPNITDITVYQYKNGDKGRIFYHRAFTSNETKNIQLYGLGENDVFHLDGKSNTSPMIRIIGGDGNDSIVDQSRVGGFGKHLKVYDSKEGNFLSLGRDGKDKTSEDTMLNIYSTKSFEYNSNMFFPYFGYSVDDGIFLGASMSMISNGFKKGPCLRPPCYNTAPYAGKQSFGFDVALKTGAFNFFYRGDFPQVFGPLGININARVQAPNYRNNWYGYGNETLQSDSFSQTDYRVHVNQALLFPALVAGDVNKIRFLFGPIYQYANVKEDSTTEFNDVFPDLTNEDLTAKHFLGVNTQLSLDPFKIDSAPKFEVRFVLNAGYLAQLNGTVSSFGFGRGYISFFYHVYSSKTHTPVLTLATRFGGGYNSGDFTSRDFQFYQSNVIGGRTNENVRGFVGERYSGKASLYNNLEMRLRLFHFNAYIFPADFGIIGLLDNGRVWVENDSSSTIHTGYGGGLWFSPFGLATLTATYAFSNDEPNGLLNIKLGWWF